MKKTIVFFPALASSLFVMAEERPNIIVVLCDDMGYSDLGCYGAEISTPHIDNLASEGVRFTQFYANSRSCPTRASLLTGLYPTNAGVGAMDRNMGLKEYQGFLRSDCVTLPELLKQSGYTTYMSGKWHLGEQEGQWPVDRGFDESFVFLGGATDYYQPQKMVRNRTKITIEDTQFYMTNAITKEAVAYIDQSHTREQPFFMYVAYTTPHWPLQAPQKIIEKYKKLYRCGWDKIREDRLSKQKELKILTENVVLSPRYKKVPEWKTVPLEEQNEWITKMAIYAAMIEVMDQGVGEIQQILKNKNLDKNTLIFFLSDNGACPHPINNTNANPDAIPGDKGSAVYYDYPWANVSNTPFQYFKRWTYEGGINVPCIISSPLIKDKGRIVHLPAHVIDIFPTCYDHARNKTETKQLSKCDGVSLLPLLCENTPRPVHAVLCWEHYGNKAVRKGNWKLVWNNSNKNGVWELYNIATDRNEQNNVASLHVEIVDELRLEYTRWATNNNVREWNEISKLQKKN